MSCRPFKLRKSASSPATVATLATVHAEPAQSVATVASAAGGEGQTLELGTASARPPAAAEAAQSVTVYSVPKPYRDALVRIKCQQPIGVGEAAWRQAIDDAGKFLDAWGSLAVEFGWTHGELFDVPHDGKSGLIWFLAGETLRALGPEHAVTKSGRVFDRMTHDEWINPYSEERGT